MSISTNDEKLRESIDLDLDWILLVLNAKSLGLSIEEVRQFIQNGPQALSKG